MAKNILTDLDLNKNKLLNVVIEYGATTTIPSDATQGQLYYDITANELKIYNGSSWEEISKQSEIVAAIEEIIKTYVGEDTSSNSTVTLGTTEPASALAGDLFFNTTSNILRIYDGSNWKDCSSSVTVDLSDYVTTEQFETAINKVISGTSGTSPIIVTTNTDDQTIKISHNKTVSISISETTDPDGYVARTDGRSMMGVAYQEDTISYGGITVLDSTGHEWPLPEYPAGSINCDSEVVNWIKNASDIISIGSKGISINGSDAITSVDNTSLSTSSSAVPTSKLIKDHLGSNYLKSTGDTASGTYVFKETSLGVNDTLDLGSEGGITLVNDKGDNYVEKLKLYIEADSYPVIQAEYKSVGDEDVDSNIDALRINPVGGRIYLGTSTSNVTIGAQSVYGLSDYLKLPTTYVSKLYINGTSNYATSIENSTSSSLQDNKP